MEQRRQEQGFQERWREARPKKITVCWLCAAVAALTMTVGFTWGGWVTAGTARTMAATLGEEAVVKRLAPICLIRFQADPKKAEKLGGERSQDGARCPDPSALGLAPRHPAVVAKGVGLRHETIEL
jgi:hypothetical protein